MAVKALSDQDRPLDLTFNEKRSPGLQEKGSKMSTRSHGDRPETGGEVGARSALRFWNLVRAWLRLSVGTATLLHAHAVAVGQGGSRRPLGQFADTSLPLGSGRDICGSSCDRRSRTKCPEGSRHRVVGGPVTSLRGLGDWPVGQEAPHLLGGHSSW